MCEECAEADEHVLTRTTQSKRVWEDCMLPSEAEIPRCDKGQRAALIENLGEAVGGQYNPRQYLKTRKKRGPCDVSRHQSGDPCKLRGPTTQPRLPEDPLPYEPCDQPGLAIGHELRRCLPLVNLSKTVTTEQLCATVAVPQKRSADTSPARVGQSTDLQSGSR
jgi:hypothetical protein